MSALLPLDEEPAEAPDPFRLASEEREQRLPPRVPRLPRAATLFWTPERVAQAIRSGILLAVIAASTALLVNELGGWSKWLDGLVTSNALALKGRHALFLSMAASGGLTALATWGLLLGLRRPAAIAWVRALALLLSPLAVLGLAAPFLRIDPWKDNPMTLGCGLAIVAYLLERTVFSALASVPSTLGRWLGSVGRWAAHSCPRLWRSLAFALVLAGVVGYGVFVAILATRHHQRLGTAAFDLGGYDNIFYNALHGRPMRCTTAVSTGENWSYMRSHADLAVYFFLPFYAIRPRAETLLWIQSFMVGLGALPVYLLAARALSRTSALLLAFAYLLFPAIHSGNFYDFHLQPLAATLILWGFYLLDTRRNIWFAIVFTIALGCREDASISLAVAGFLMVFAGYRPLAGGVVAGVSTVYFLLMKFVIMTHFGPWWFSDMYKDLLPSGDNSFFGVINTLVTNPLYSLNTLLTREKVLHVLKIFLPLAFLPLRRVGLWFGFVPAILGTILTTGYHPTTDTTFQYIFYWVPFIFLFTILVLAHITRKSGARAQAAAVVALTFATLASSYHWGAVFQRETFAAAWGRINLAPLSKEEWQILGDLRALGAKIPPKASASMSEGEVPHFSNRPTIFTLRLSGANDADYVLYHRESGDAGARQGQEALASGKYRRVEERGKFVLLKRVGLP